MNATQIATCPDCHTSHLGRCGGLTYAQRLRSIRLDTSVTPSRTRRSYYEPESVRAMFGDDAKEKMLDDTQGLGYVRREGGRYYQRDRSGEVREVGAGALADQFMGEEIEPA